LKDAKEDSWYRAKTVVAMLVANDQLSEDRYNGYIQNPYAIARI